MQIVLVTGLSGSGKSTVLKGLEDHNFYCVDNLPPAFIRPVIDFLIAHNRVRVAVSVDTRSGAHPEELLSCILDLQREHQIQLIFLTAQEDVIMRRFSETRRRHPLASFCHTLSECIHQEKEWLSALSHNAYTVDTSALTVNQLRFWVIEYINCLEASAPLTVVLESFAYKQGIPLDVNFLFDVRCLPNPYYQKTLRHKTGLDPEVSSYFMQQSNVAVMIHHISDFLLHWIPSFIYETRVVLTIGVGCTGGQHRSVFVVESVADQLRSTYPVLVRHRQLHYTNVTPVDT